MTNSSAPTVQKKGRRIFWWTFLAVQLLFLIWVVSGVNAGTSTPTPGLSGSYGTQAHEVGTTIAVGLQIFLWAAVDTIIGFGVLVHKALKR